MENKVNYYAIAMIYVGTMFGAGFVSGQEILQFFGCNTNYAIFGTIILGILVLIFSFVVMHNSYISQPTSFEQLIIGKNNILKYIVNFLFLFFACGVLIIMFAGAGALFNSIFHFPNIIGTIFICLIVLFIGLYDTAGIISAFKILTPLMFIVALITSLLGLNINLDNSNTIINSIQCPGINWWFSAILYMSYNFFLAIAVLGPLGKNAKSTNDILKGSLLSSIILCLTSSLLIIVIINNFSTVYNVEMPMLAIASKISPLMNNIYAFVLFGGLLSASIGMIFAILNYFSNINNRIINNNKITIPILCLIAVILSNFGFSQLISIVYPLLGYIGLLAILGVTLNYIINLKNR